MQKIPCVLAEHLKKNLSGGKNKQTIKWEAKQTPGLTPDLKMHSIKWNKKFYASSVEFLKKKSKYQICL